MRPEQTFWQPMRPKSAARRSRSARCRPAPTTDDRDARRVRFRIYLLHHPNAAAALSDMRNRFLDQEGDNFLYQALRWLQAVCELLLDLQLKSALPLVRHRSPARYNGIKSALCRRAAVPRRAETLHTQVYLVCYLVELILCLWAWCKGHELAVTDSGRRRSARDAASACAALRARAVDQACHERSQRRVSR